VISNSEIEPRFHSENGVTVANLTVGNLNCVVDVVLKFRLHARDIILNTTFLKKMFNFWKCLLENRNNAHVPRFRRPNTQFRRPLPELIPTNIILLFSKQKQKHTALVTHSLTGKLNDGKRRRNDYLQGSGNQHTRYNF
jgi:hypothetical protein